MELNFGDKVRIIELETIGRVLGIYITEVGTRYEVRYFYNGESKVVYFFKDELVPV